MPFPSRRLAAIFGAELEDLSWESLGHLIGQPEDSDLEFKREMYATSESARIEAAKDVAAFASLGGGLIVVGMAENDGTASELQPWAADEAAERWIREVVTERVVPYLDVAIRRVTSDNGYAVLMIAVPASTDAPHGVRNRETLRFPVRDGARVRYMSEAELAAMYRRRFAAADERSRRLEDVETSGKAHLEVDKERPRPWLTVSVVPLRRVELRLQAATREKVAGQFRGAIARSCPNSPFSMRTPLQTRVGIREVQLTDEDRAGMPPHGSFAVLHSDGSAFVAGSFWGSMGPGLQDSAEFQLPRDFLTTYALGLLDLACSHPVACGASGDALVSVDLFVPGGELGRRLALVNEGNMIPPPTGWPLMTTKFTSERYTVPLPEVVESGSELVAATYWILADLEAAFGQPEPRFVRQDGAITTWLLPMNVGDWAERRGIAVVNPSVQSV